MKIVIAGGMAEADFLISSLKGKHKIKVINPDKDYAQYLADTQQVPVTFGDPCKEYILEATEIGNYDVLIALMPADADNLAVCQMAKEKFGIKKTVSVVANPRNVELFKMFGITEVISSAYLAAQQLAKISTLENLVNTFSLENSTIEVVELEVAEKCRLSGVPLSDMKLPSQVIIACIIRSEKMIVPNGRSIVQDGDRLIFVSPAETREELAELFTVADY